MTSIEQKANEFPLLVKELQEVEDIYSDLQLTVEQLEADLQKPEHLAIEPVRFGKLTRMQKTEINTAEKVTGFGHTVGDSFEDLIKQFGRVPTQKEYADYSLARIKAWWTVETAGVDWSETVEQAVYNRQLRSYSSHLVELHTMLSLRKLFPDWQIYCTESIDLLMGVDLVIETEQKRLYIHIFKNSKSAFRAFRKKEFRGGRKNNSGKFKKYKRDFTGDKSLQYDWSQSQCSESTKFINGNPLFKEEYLFTQLTMFNSFKQFGQPLKEMQKLEYLEQFLQSVS